MKRHDNTLLYELLPIILCGLAIPLSIFMWLGNIAFSKIKWGSEMDAENSVIPPTRWLFSTLAPIMLMVYAIKRKAVSKSGAVLGIIIAIILSIASHAFFASLVVFFFTSSRATRFRGEMKRSFEADHKGGEGKRNWTQVLCNGGMATQLALLYLLDCGSGERPINFSEHYRSSWLGIGIMSAFASCNGDTWASELGTVLSSADPFLITTWKRVPRGTNGGVSFIGILLSFIGGAFVGLGYYLTVRYTVDSPLLIVSPVQWPLIIYGGIAGLLGSLVDSLLGATLQYSGVDRSGKIVDHYTDDVKYISGLRILDNHSVNLISSIVMGVLMPIIALKTWPLIY
ncbi:unnamed protein product [Hermetia illucens]|uniref:Transmembrane protein 19 n=1 Tax=Hermetia illucens TaxID=343691 RepID=A0A7R8UHP6_HERIL|nr:transmembrane protein 19 [Hermetia illucens]CAD7081080.1 unnamed protein product [Hermetia illucens]